MEIYYKPNAWHTKDNRYIIGDIYFESDAEQKYEKNELKKYIIMDKSSVEHKIEILLLDRDNTTNCSFLKIISDDNQIYRFNSFNTIKGKLLLKKELINRIKKIIKEWN